MASAAIQAELSLNTAAFTAAFGSVRGLISGAGSKIASLWPALLGAGAAAFAGVAAGAVGMKKALDVGGELSDLSTQTGVAAGELAVLRQAFTNNGMAAEDVGGALNKMQKAIAGGAEVFGQLGIDLEALRGQDASAQLKTVGAAIDGIADPAQRTAAAMDVFGKSGGKMLTLFSDSGAMDSAAAQVGTQAEILNRNAALFDDVSDKLGLAGQKTQGFFVGVADKVAPVLAPLLEKFVSLDLAKYGQQLGEGVAFIVQALADGKLGAILFNSARIAFANAVNFLAGGLAGAGAGLGQMMLESVKNAVELFQIVTTADFWAGVGNAFVGIAQGFNALLLDGIAMLLEQLKGIPLIGDKIGKGAEVLRDAATAQREQGQENRGEAADLLTPALEKIRGRMADGMAAVREAAVRGFDAGNNVIDTSEWQSQMESAVGEVMASAEAAGTKARAGLQEKTKTGVLGAEAGEDEKNREEEKERLRGVKVDDDRRVGLGGVAYVPPKKDKDGKGEAFKDVGGVKMDKGAGEKGGDNSVAGAIAKLGSKLDAANTLLKQIAAKPPGGTVTGFPVFKQ